MKSGRRNATGKRNRINNSSGSEDNRSSAGKKDAVVPRKNPVQRLDDCWAPSSYTAFKALLSARLCAAIWSNISDCDETFNYWEPTHFLLYNSGFQTWEYSPDYALRSYAYLLVHAFPAWIYGHLFQSNKVLVFYFLRCLLGFCCAASESYFYAGSKKVFGNGVARCLLVFLVFSPGIFVSSAAFLPSSFCMYFTSLIFACLFARRDKMAVFCVAVSTFLGWPFSAVLGLPVAYKILFADGKWMQFAKWCSLALVFVLVPMVHIDSYFYGKLVIAPLNIVMYNVFGERGPELYGVEPWTFYMANGFLNFNLVFVLAAVSLPVVLISLRFLGPTARIGPFLYASLPMYLWYLVFCVTKHKEERFLFPANPLVCLCGATCLVHIQDVVNKVLRKLGVVRGTGKLSVAVIIAFALLAISRIVALYAGYHAPFDVYVEAGRLAPSHHHAVNICVAKEWHRFPNSFFLPDNWRLRFVRSEFRGQLPTVYGEGKNATRVAPERVNDANLEEPSRYTDVTKCHYLVDLDLEAESAREPRYASRTDQWETVFSAPFLDAGRSPRLWRSFYVPFVSQQRCVFADYKLLRSVSLTNRKPITLGNAHT